jgi:hypothetical protein
MAECLAGEQDGLEEEAAVAGVLPQEAEEAAVAEEQEDKFIIYTLRKEHDSLWLKPLSKLQ